MGAERDGVRVVTNTAESGAVRGSDRGSTPRPITPVVIEIRSGWRRDVGQWERIPQPFTWHQQERSESHG